MYRTLLILKLRNKRTLSRVMPALLSILMHKGDHTQWDTNQLLAQANEAVEIFEGARKRALFIFDQSSSHASLPPDALKAFETNKGDSGKQRRQKDTILPNSNPVGDHRGKAQSMIVSRSQTDDTLVTMWNMYQSKLS
jgi:hypothetical protein